MKLVLHSLSALITRLPNSKSSEGQSKSVQEIERFFYSYVFKQSSGVESQKIKFLFLQNPRERCFVGGFLASVLDY